MTEEIRRYYESYDEDGRLIRDKAHLPEYLTTLRYFDRLIQPKSRILDACAGTGRYSLYLAGQGHIVTACDLVEHHVNIIKSKDKVNQLSDIVVSNILDLSRFEDESFDVVLSSDADFEKYMEYHYMTCEDESILGTSTHGLWMGRKPR